MFTAYNVLKTLHILAAIVTIGWLLTDAMVLPRAIRSGQVAVVRFADSVASKVGPAAGLVLLLGIALVADNDSIDFGDHWVMGAIVLFLVAMVNGAVFIGGAARRAAEKLEAGQDASAEASRVALLAGVNGVLLVILVWLMVARPH